MILAAGAQQVILILCVIGAIFVLSLFLLVSKQYKRCPSNKVLVVYGRVRGGLSSKCLHGGAHFVLPLVQNYAYLDLEPIQIEIPLKGALSMENIRVSVPSVFTVAIGTEPEVMQNAAIRLLQFTRHEIMEQARDIIFGQLRLVIASMRIEDINRDRDKFLSNIQDSLEPELRKIGLVLINVNITDITDESGYIEAIGRKAASTAIQQATIDVAEQEKKGSIGVAEAEREKAIQVANAVKEREIGTKVAEQERRIRVADADAKAVTGENVARANIAASEAQLKVKQAEAYQLGETKVREAEAAVLEAQYHAQAKAAEAQAVKVEAEKRAELEAPAKAMKAQVVVDAEAEAERRRIEAEGEAKAIFARLEAEARGEFEKLQKKGLGLRSIVEACEGAQQAFQLLMLEHVDHLGETAARAIQNIKFDKIYVWDTGRDGSSATAGFLQNLAGALPPALQLLKNIGGVDMPAYFGKLAGDSGAPAKAPAEAPAPAAPTAKEPPAPGSRR